MDVPDAGHPAGGQVSACGTIIQHGGQSCLLGGQLSDGFHPERSLQLIHRACGKTHRRPVGVGEIPVPEHPATQRHHLPATPVAYGDAGDQATRELRGGPAFLVDDSFRDSHWSAASGIHQMGDQPALVVQFDELGAQTDQPGLRHPRLLGGGTRDESIRDPCRFRIGQGHRPRQQLG